MQFQDPSIITLSGKKPGAELVLMAGTHGNEMCGVLALRTLLTTLQIQSGTVHIIFANLAAIALGKRSTQANLNRVFRPAKTLSDKERASYELQRAKVLMPYLKRCDALLDIHSTRNPKSVPFVICEPRSFDVARHLPFSLISDGWDKIEPGGTDYYVNLHGGRGICVECGNHNDPQAPKRAQASIFRFLEYFGAIKPQKQQNTTKRQRFVHVEWLHIAQKTFKPQKKFGDFEDVARGQIIGLDGRKIIRASDDGVVLFVEACSAGGEAFIFGK